MSASLLHLIAVLTVAASVAVLIVAATRKPLRWIGGIRVAYLSWLLVPASQLVVLLPAPSPPLEGASQTIPDLAGNAFPAALSSDYVLAGVSYAATNYAAIGVSVWAAGSLLMLLLVIWRQRVFIRSLGVVTLTQDGTYRSLTVRGPVLVGAWRPRVVLPANFEALYDTEERALVLAHERAHQERGDALVNVGATIWLCLSWFNPLMYWAIARFRFDQELACDAVALAPRTTLRRRYADALLRTQLASEAGLPPLIGCPWQSGHPLNERIAMLKRPLPTTQRQLSAFLLTCTMMLFGSYIVWTALPRPAHAQVDLSQADLHQAIVVSDSRQSTLTAERVLRLPNGDLDFSGNVILKSAVDTPRIEVTTGPDGSLSRVIRGDDGSYQVEGRIRIVVEDGGSLNTNRATVEKDGTIRMDSARFTPSTQPH